MAELILSEFDKSGELLATFSDEGSEIHAQASKVRKSRWQQVLDVFLPVGYPHSVTEDYLAYQFFDSVQAFCSAIAGMLSSRAVLEGIGVGDKDSRPTTAILLTVLQESYGRIATITFAHRLGSAIEPECKMYRLAADFFNDAALILDCLSPAFPRPVRVGILSAASILRALCGVAAGSAKASLSAHFAKWGNLGEVNAKDSSQETIVSLLGMLAGSAVVSMVEGPFATWLTLTVLLILHLGTNYAAVRSVSMNSLNRQRANIAFSHLIAHDKVLTPKQIAKSERIFENDGVLRWCDDSILGHARIGVGVPEFLRNVQLVHPHRGAEMLRALVAIFKDEAFLLWFHASTGTAHIVLKKDCDAQSQLKAWCTALQTAWDRHRQCRERGEGDVDGVEEQKQGGAGAAELAAVSTALQATNRSFEDYCQRLRGAGFDLSIEALETHASSRVAV